MVRASHWSSEGCRFDPPLGLRNRFRRIELHARSSVIQDISNLPYFQNISNNVSSPYKRFPYVSIFSVPTSEGLVESRPILLLPSKEWFISAWSFLSYCKMHVTKWEGGNWDQLPPSLVGIILLFQQKVTFFPRKLLHLCNIWDKNCIFGAYFTFFGGGVK